MIELKQDLRYRLLLSQMSAEKTLSSLNPEAKISFKYLVSFLYNQTNIIYLSSIDEQILYNYIRYHARNNFKQRSFAYVIKDIKRFIYYLKINGIEPPTINLSTLNFKLWLSL